MSKIIILLLITLSSLFSSSEHVKVCYLEWGKLGGKNLPSYGLVPDVVSTTLKEAGYEPEVTIMPWARCLKLVSLKKYDMVAGFWIGEEQKKSYQYFEPNTIDDIAFITLKGFLAKSGKIEDFYGKKVGLIRDAGGLENFYSKEKNFKKVMKVDNDIQLVRLLKAGRIDAIISDPVQVLSKVDAMFPELINKLKVWDPVIQRNIGAPAVAKDHPKRDELEKRYNNAFKKLVKQGLYDEMMKKHDVVLNHKKY